jgi:alpha-beta hydrolase superfamily lysophospholipase
MVEIRKAAEALQHCLPQIICPVALVQATDDPIVDPQSAQLIQSQVAAMKKSLYMISSTSHDILLENVGDTQALVVSLLDAMAAPLPKITPLPIGFMKKMVGLLAGMSTKFFQRHAKK